MANMAMGFRRLVRYCNGNGRRQCFAVATAKGLPEGFAEALIPLNGSPQEKVDALLANLHRLPERFAEPLQTEGKDPIKWLRYDRFLSECGTASMAFVHLAQALGLSARCLLLLNEQGETKHVTVEVWLNGRWVVADPLWGALLRDQEGRLLSKEQLRNPQVFREVRESINYPREYTFERYSYINWGKVPLIGKALGAWLRRVGFEEKLGRPLVLDNQCLQALYFWAANTFVACLALLASRWRMAKLETKS